MEKVSKETEQQCAINNVRHSAFFDEVCENDFNEWDKEMKVIETYPKWEVLGNALGRVKRWKSSLHCA